MNLSVVIGIVTGILSAFAKKGIVYWFNGVLIPWYLDIHSPSYVVQGIWAANTPHPNFRGQRIYREKIYISQLG